MAKPKPRKNTQMKLSLTQNRNWKNFEGKTFPETARLLEIEILHPDSLEEHTGARFEEDIYLTFPVYKKADRWSFDFSLPSWFPTEGDGCVGFRVTHTKQDGLSISLNYGRFTLGWASADVGNPSLFTNRFGFSFCSCFATGIGG